MSKGLEMQLLGSVSPAELIHSWILEIWLVGKSWMVIYW